MAARTICIGVMMNSSLFAIFMYTFLTQPNLMKPVDFIMIHLTVVNTLNIIFTLIPHIMALFGVRYFLDDIGCKVISYTYRITRGVSISTTSHLSAFQAITISPMNSMWVWFKSKLSSWIFPSFFVFWIINMLIYIHIIETVRANGNFTIVDHKYFHAYCQTRPSESHTSGLFSSIMLMDDLLFLVLMIWASLYMVSLLYRHQRRAQHVHRHSLSSQPSPEIKVTHSILLVVSLFVFFYCLKNYFTYYSFYGQKKFPGSLGIGEMLSVCYPIICPFMIMKNKKIISYFISSLSDTFYHFIINSTLLVLWLHVQYPVLMIVRYKFQVTDQINYP
ncbi:vomeronasal type-1 receptor 4-like [Heterocephalus glaber]|uniref:Vomeronasal type-1 receptor n=1 Tax=Heterocephalus glaber TaxID=10181 RepID=A0AAX6QIM7_HETGA|nr:vomeronasal type-1 receptor 4-like [Heterocephalus glaber]